MKKIELTDREVKITKEALDDFWRDSDLVLRQGDWNSQPKEKESVIEGVVTAKDVMDKLDKS